MLHEESFKSHAAFSFSLIKITVEGFSEIYSSSPALKTTFKLKRCQFCETDFYCISPCLARNILKQNVYLFTYSNGEKTSLATNMTQYMLPNHILCIENNHSPVYHLHI